MGQIGKSYGHKIIKTLKIDLTPNYGSTLWEAGEGSVMCEYVCVLIV